MGFGVSECASLYFHLYDLGHGTRLCFSASCLTGNNNPVIGAVVLIQLLHHDTKRLRGVWAAVPPVLCGRLAALCLGDLVLGVHVSQCRTGVAQPDG